MAIIGKIRKHSGLVVIVVGVAIAAFVIGDFSKKSPRGVNEIGEVNGDVIPVVDFNAKVEEALEIQKENSNSDKITDEETYNIRQSTWNTMTRDILMNEEYEKLGLTVSSDELFDQVQGKNPHRYILQYFKDPKTGQYDPALVLEYLKNLDKMEPKAKTQWLRFEKAIKEDRIQTKYTNLFSKGYYMPKQFAAKQFVEQSQALKIRYISPAFANIPDSTVKLTDADYQNYYNKNKQYFYQDEAYRDIDYVVFDVVPSDIDRKKIAEEVQVLYNDMLTSTDIPNFTNANSDKKYDSAFMKKGTLPGRIDSVAFASAAGTFVAPVEVDGKTWNFGQLIAVQERPDSVNASQVLIGFSGTPLAEQNKITRSKDQAKKKADSIMLVLKKSPEKLTELAKTISDYPTAKEDGGDLKWIVDNDPNFFPFFNAALTMKPGDVKVVETAIGYAVLKVSNKTKPIKKVRFALVQRQIVPSNQTFQDTYLKASTFAGQNKTPDAFEKGAVAAKLAVRKAQNVKEMDNQVSGLTGARELVRWTYSENVKIDEVSPVFDLSGKYVVALLKSTSDKGLQPLDKIKTKIEANVKNYKKIEIMAEKMKKAMASKNDLYALAVEFSTKVDTADVTFLGYGRSAIANDGEVVGELFTAKTGVLSGPFIGNYGAYVAIVDGKTEVTQKADYSGEQQQMRSEFESRALNTSFVTLQRKAVIVDNRARFF